MSAFMASRTVVEVSKSTLFTLSEIRRHKPCASGWITLLRGLGYNDANFDPKRQVSLGDIARINDAADALWCVRCLDWADLQVRVAVVRDVLLPAARRVEHLVAEYPQAKACNDATEAWCREPTKAHADALVLAARAANAATWAADAADAATWAADAAARAAANAANAANAAANAANAAAWAATWDGAWAAEGKQQRADIIAAFPPTEAA